MKIIITVAPSARLRLVVTADITDETTSLLHAHLEGDREKENLLGYFSQQALLRIAALTLEAFEGSVVEYTHVE